ncbi:MAG: hypothetical protein JRG89_10165 [Deltaproteobacteria bacterium]|nr:hypothetical protein [Deltaproteobacteria bacterium]MBW2388789.1 hypothetical protein [Deltaproteobacteria bacterium]
MRNRRIVIAGAVVIAVTIALYVLRDSTLASVEPEELLALAPAQLAVTPPPIPPEHMPPPFGERRIVFPAMFPRTGEAPPSETAAFCDDSNWGQIDLVVSRSEGGAFWVDEDAWNRELTGSKVGLASWMSQCHRDGAPIEIVAADTGALLATYDARTGLRSHP